MCSFSGDLRTLFRSFARKALWPSILAGALALVASEALAEHPIPGKYLCVSDKVAGVWKNSNGAEGAGVIEPTPKEEKFFINIKKELHLPDCYGPANLDTLQKYRPTKPPQSDKDWAEWIANLIDNGIIANPQGFFDYCLANFELNVVGSDLGVAGVLTFRSVDGFEFRSNEKSFSLDSDGQFVAYGQLFDRGIVFSVTSGRCEFIPPPDR